MIPAPVEYDYKFAEELRRNPNVWAAYPTRDVYGEVATGEFRSVAQRIRNKITNGRHGKGAYQSTIGRFDVRQTKKTMSIVARYTEESAK